MFGILTTIISAFVLGKVIIKDKTEKPAPKGTRFDWDAYYADIRNGISPMEQVRKREKGGYNTTKPKQPNWWELPIDTVVDVERYERDKETYGEETAEMFRRNGYYRTVRPH